MRFPILLALVLAGLAESAAAELTVAVASNFRGPAEEIGELFSRATGHRVRLSVGSTGKLYAQITNGAPFDVFLAADAKRPRLLVEAGLAVPGTRTTYAIGGLVLWSREPGLDDDACVEALGVPDAGRIAIANPAIAPYGAAAKQFLEATGLWQDVEPRLVYGENITQTLQFVVTANAAFGLIARSQAIDPRLPAATCSWPVPARLHEPVVQQAVVLRRAENRVDAADFIDFLKSAAAADVIERFGYTTES